VSLARGRLFNVSYGKLSLQEINHLIGIELLTSNFLNDFDIHCFVTAVLWSILHVSGSSELLMRLSWQPTITEIPPLHLLAESAPLIIVILFAFKCSATMLTSKLVTEITENHSEFYVWANSCSKVLSNRSLINHEITSDTVMQGHLCPVAPSCKGQRGQYPPNAPPFRRSWLCANAWADNFRWLAKITWFVSNEQ